MSVWSNSFSALTQLYRRSRLRSRFLLLFYVVTLLSVSLVAYVGFSHTRDAHHSKATELVTGYTSEVANKIDTFQELVRNDLFYLANNHNLLQFLYWHSLSDTAQSNHWRNLTSEQLQQFANAYPYHYKIRFINAQGQEVLAVKRDLASGRVRVLEEHELQQYQQKEFFVRGMKLARGQIYASSINPNNEMGMPERPLVPVIRFVTPVMGENGVRYGLLVINVLAEQYFSYLSQVNQLDVSRQFFLVSPQGEYLYHPQAGKSAVQNSGSRANFNVDYPEVLDQVKQKLQKQEPIPSGEVQLAYDQEQHQLRHGGYIFSLRHLHPNVQSHENGFFLVGLADEQYILKELDRFIAFFVGLLVVVVALVLLAARYFVDGLMGPLSFVTQQLALLGRGQTNDTQFQYAFDDEIKRMLDSCGILTANMQQLTKQADAISQGDFSREVVLLSEQDQLGVALNNMTQMLQQARSQEQRSNWLKDGLGQLNQELTGDMNPQQLAEAAISLTCRYLEAGRGVFFRYVKAEQQLELLGSYMYLEREALNNRFALGEGAVGQVALERKPIVLHQTHSNLSIVTGTLSVPAQHSYCYPLLREGELLGVIELATLTPLDHLQLEFVSKACDVMAALLYVVDQHQQICHLLNMAEQAKQEAQQQSTRLQEANLRLENQQRQLQQQAETLQSANVQLEEQQQQLRQQTEELQASNAQMEEQQQQLRQQAEELQEANAQMEEQQQQMVQQALELERNNADLNASRDALDQRARDLEQASQYKSEFLANMSHELRTPLNSIILLSKMLAMNEEHHLSDEEVKRASIVHKAGEELLRLINDILDLSKIEAGKMEVRQHSIQSRDFVSEFSDLFNTSAEQKNIQFRIEDQLQAEFVSDRDKLSQIVRNLLSNAFKFTKQGFVCLRLQHSDRPAYPICISVSDSGVGIPQDKQQLVFEAFQQVDGSTAREFGGTGLGLTISRRYAELLGGKLELHSEVGQGSEFVIYLPSAVQAAPASQATSSTAPPIPALTKSAPSQVLHDDRTNLKTSDAVILLVDDDPVFCEAIMSLNKRLGYKTLLANSGQEGLRMAHTYRPKGILLDLGLPDLDGSEVLHQIKADRELRHIPVYIVSARDQDQSQLQDDICGYLQKPIAEEQLANAESNALAQVQQQSRQILLLAGPQLDASSLQALPGQAGLPVVTQTELNGALTWLQQHHCQLVIIDLSIWPALATCRALKQAQPNLPLILYSPQALSSEQEAELRPYTDSIIVKAGKADVRMLENIQRFLQQMPHTISLAHPNQPSSPKLQGKHILVVDDDPRNLFVITSALEQQGAQVGNALNGAKGLEYLRQQPVDLVLMDIMMPEMDGYEVIRQIRADTQIRHIPIVALTAKALKADRQKALDAGANDYLSKPVDYEVLVNMVRIWCEEKTLATGGA